MDSITLDQVLVDRLKSARVTKATRAGLSGRTLSDVSMDDLLACTAGLDGGEEPVDDPTGLYTRATTTTGGSIGPSGYGIREIAIPEEDE